MVLGELTVPGRPTNLGHSRARAYCACNRCGGGMFGHFSLVYLFSFLSPILPILKPITFLCIIASKYVIGL